MEAKPKSRKVAWVVLGVVGIAAALSIASVWDKVWLKVAYIPEAPLIQIADQQETVSFYISAKAHKGLKPHHWGKTIKLSAGSLPAPPTANSAQSYRLRFKWLSGPYRLGVFYDHAGREVSREPIVIEFSMDP